jgi:hypothetical protein
MPPVLAAALVKAQHEVESAHLNAHNSERDYAYATAEEIVRTAKAALRKVGLAVYPAGLELRSEADGLTMLRTWTLLHESGASWWFPVQWPVHMQGPRDKAVAAATTFGLGYFLRDLLLIDRAMGEAVDARKEASGGKWEAHYKVTLPDRNEHPEPVAKAEWTHTKGKEPPPKFRKKSDGPLEFPKADAPIEAVLELEPGDGLPPSQLASAPCGVTPPADNEATPTPSAVEGAATHNEASDGLSPSSPVVATAPEEAPPPHNSPASSGAGLQDEERCPDCTRLVGWKHMTHDVPGCECPECASMCWGDPLACAEARDALTEPTREQVNVVAKAAEAAAAPGEESDDVIVFELTGDRVTVYPAASATSLPPSWQPGAAWRRCPVKKLRESITERRCAICDALLKSREEVHVGLAPDFPPRSAKRRSSKPVGYAHVSCVESLAGREEVSA